MESTPTLRDHVAVPVVDPRGHRENIAYRANEFVRIVPYAFSYVRWVLYVLLVVGSGGLLLIVSVWFPQVFTRIARLRLPQSSIGDAQFMLVLVQEDEYASNWVEVPVHRYVKKVEVVAEKKKQQLSWWRRLCKKEDVSEGGDEDEPVDDENKEPPLPWWRRLCAKIEVVETDLFKPTAEKPPTPWIWFEFKKHRYVFNAEKGEYEHYLATIKESVEKMRSRLDTGLDHGTVADKIGLFGTNLVDIDPPSILMLLFTKVVHPYYLFQVFSATVWFCQKYTIYAIIILVLSAISMAWEIYSEISNCNRLRALVRSNHELIVYRTNAAKEVIVAKVHETELVPGDIVELNEGPVVADILLLAGSCIVDEASLTGEAVPINKVPTDSGTEIVTETEAQTHYKSSFLHAGSIITRVRRVCKDCKRVGCSCNKTSEGIQQVSTCKGVILSTGFSTGKGELFRSILFPRELSFEFERDSYRYLAVLATIAIAAFIKRLVNFAHQGYGIGYSMVNSLDLITIAVPPALPLVLSSGIGFALKRLQQRGIFCIDAQRINSCGQLDTFCFDKTGTLTQESMTLVGFDKRGTNNFDRVDVAHLPKLVRLAMATCHSISDVDGHLHGSPLELAMYEAAGISRTTRVNEETKAEETWVDGDGGACRPVKHFAFDAACQRSSVVLEFSDKPYRFIFVKGSPEAIEQIAVSRPTNWMQHTLRLAADGNYCIAFGMRVLQEGEVIDLTDRTLVEKEIHIMGIALFHNELKPESTGMVRELYDADIDVRMITGDNALTAVHIARALDMKLHEKVALVDVNKSAEVVYHCLDDFNSTDPEEWEHLTKANVSRVLSKYDLAITGGAIQELKTELSDDSIKQLVLATQIFARIRPTEKAWIVERLMDYGKIVGMCGDGTNDCGALKAAHVGLALSSAEASIVAPFTSKAKDVTDVPVLIREGRCALTTSFLGFKFMVLYPVIQLGMASTLGHFGTMLTNNQYLWDDLAIVLGLAITMLYTGSSTRLSKERPPHTLFSKVIVLSIFGQIVLFIGIFAATFAILNHQSWFCRRADGMKLAQAYLDNPLTISSKFPPTVLQNCAFIQNHMSDISEVVDDISVSHEDSSVWLFGHMQYFPVALAFNLKDRFRLPFYTNLVFTTLYIAGLGVNLWFLLDNSGTINKSFQTLPLDSNYRWMMFGMFAAHFVLALIWEAAVTGAFLQWREEIVEKRSLKAKITQQQEEKTSEDPIEILFEGVDQAEPVIDVPIESAVDGDEETCEANDLDWDEIPLEALQKAQPVEITTEALEALQKAQSIEITAEESMVGTQGESPPPDEEIKRDEKSSEISSQESDEDEDKDASTDQSHDGQDQDESTTDPSMEEESSKQNRISLT